VATVGSSYVPVSIQNLHKFCNGCAPTDNCTVDRNGRPGAYAIGAIHPTVSKTREQISRANKKGIAMKKFALSVGTAAVMAAAALELAGAAAAAPAGPGSASDVIKQLQDEGYAIQLNGNRTAPLSDCNVLEVDPSVSGPASPTEFTTVYVNISCPPRNN